MISDVLFEAVEEIDRYLNDEAFRYAGETRARIIRCRDEMDAIRAMLDTPPKTATPPRLVGGAPQEERS